MREENYIGKIGFEIYFNNFNLSFFEKIKQILQHFTILIFIFILDIF